MRITTATDWGNNLCPSLDKIRVLTHYALHKVGIKHLAYAAMVWGKGNIRHTDTPSTRFAFIWIGEVCPENGDIHTDGSPCTS
jgi:hypothetical protein